MDVSNIFCIRARGALAAQRPCKNPWTTLRARSKANHQYGIDRVRPCRHPKAGAATSMAIGRFSRLRHLPTWSTVPILKVRFVRCGSGSWVDDRKELSLAPGIGPLANPSAVSSYPRRITSMTYVVVENCIKCKYMDCVEVCPVDCFYEGENMLVIHPDECIDCGVCEPECPAEAIKPDTEP